MSGPSKINNNSNIPRALPTLPRLLFHADPITGIAKACTVSELVALFSTLTPTFTYADETALLANDEIPVGFIAVVLDSGFLYLYNGPDHDDINSYLLLNPSPFRGSYDLTAEAYPSSGGTGPGGIPKIGDHWYGINSGDFDVEGLGTITLFRGALLYYIGGTVSDGSSWVVKQ